MTHTTSCHRDTMEDRPSTLDRLGLCRTGRTGRTERTGRSPICSCMGRSARCEANRGAARRIELGVGDAVVEGVQAFECVSEAFSVLHGFYRYSSLIVGMSYLSCHISFGRCLHFDLLFHVCNACVGFV